VRDRLPRIAPPEAAPPAPGPDKTPVPGPSAPAAAETDDPLPPLSREARDFANPEGRPMLAVLFVDDGAPGADRAALAALDLPLSVVLDPLLPGAAEIAAVWRTGGQEVVMAASGLPRGATPADVEQTLQELAQRLPQAVALIEPPFAEQGGGSGFQADRALAAQIVGVLKAQGRGLVTFDRGLNSAEQVAAREGLASVTVFRLLDAEDEAAPVIRRYLDRAAFRAAQEGEVAVLGRLRPATLQALIDWAGDPDSRASGLALAPISALMAP
jgi:hypothetical protein